MKCFQYLYSTVSILQYWLYFFSLLSNDIGDLNFLPT